MHLTNALNLTQQVGRFFAKGKGAKKASNSLRSLCGRYNLLGKVMRKLSIGILLAVLLPALANAQEVAKEQWVQE
jgi:hypothetical protein